MLKSNYPKVIMKLLVRQITKSFVLKLNKFFNRFLMANPVQSLSLTSLTTGWSIWYLIQQSYSGIGSLESLHTRRLASTLQVLRIMVILYVLPELTTRSSLLFQRIVFLPSPTNMWGLGENCTTFFSNIVLILKHSSHLSVLSLIFMLMSLLLTQLKCFL